MGVVVLALLLLQSVAWADPTKDEIAVLGKRVYSTGCVPCHGSKGDGKGPAAAYLNPKPRDFTRGVYKFRTTDSGSNPTDEDLARSVDRGLPGTSMPAWKGLLSVGEREAVIAYIKDFSKYMNEPIYPEEVIVTADKLSARPEATEQSITAGKLVYERMQCANCHGDDGRGNPANRLEDDFDQPIKAFDFTRGRYRGGSTAEDIYRSFTTGLDGTPMPSYAYSLDETERWQLVDYVQSLNRKRPIVRYLFDPPGWNHTP
jgi:mono/diheme cytochrome c family protein